jgi:hypothetical protein
MTLKEMHHEDEAKRMLVAGWADHSHTDNSVSTAKYTLLTFLPIVSFMPWSTKMRHILCVMGLCGLDLT